MKKLFYLLIIGVLGLVSCDKKLNLEPWEQASTTGVFQSIEDFENGVRGIYASLKENGAFGISYMFIFPDVTSDNLIQCQAGRLSLTEAQNWTYSSNYYVAASIWTDMYAAINNANQIITNLEPFEVTTEKQALKNQLLGEAYALRALLHFRLVKYFGKAYSQANAGDLGVAYMKKSEVGFPSRETIISNYSNIVADLTTALSLVTIDNGRYRISPAAVNGIFAQVNLEMGNYTDAITHADASLTDRGICSLNKFKQIWTDQTADGAVFYIQIVESDAINLGDNYSQSSSSTGTKSEFVADYSLYQLYSSNDIRLGTYFITRSYNGILYNHIAKYMQRTGAVTPNMVDLKLLRAEEILLIKAEAHYMIGGQDVQALDALNQLRRERYTAYVDGDETGTDLFNAIQLQRRLELAFEGDRLFTLKRLKKSVERNMTYGDYANGAGTPYKSESLQAGDSKFVLPIPQNEINANENMVQNDGY
jgi:starch-binding outer membrane protein, SusD/RagB family